MGRTLVDIVDEATRSSRAAESIAASRLAFVAAIRAGDAKAAASVYSRGARLVAPATELIRGRDSIEWFWRTGVEAGIFDVEFLVDDLRDGAQLAFEIGRYGLWLRSSRSETVVDHGRYVLIHERQPGGSWCRAVEMFSPEAPSAMSADARPVR